jgi:hypothetical protein
MLVRYWEARAADRDVDAALADRVESSTVAALYYQAISAGNRGVAAALQKKLSDLWDLPEPTGPSRPSSPSGQP